MPATRHHLRDLLDRVDVAELIRRRAVQEALADALAHTWTRRAEALEWAQERPGDYPGGPVDWLTGKPLNAPPADLERAAALVAAAFACRRKAALLEARVIDFE